MGCCSRRQFLQQSLQAGVALCGLHAGLGCSSIAPASPIADVTLPTDGTLRLSKTDYPDLLLPGGALTFRIVNQPHIGAIIVAHVGDEQWVTVASACTHAGCAVGYSSGHKAFECPCHGSTFALDGAVTRAPATAPLQSFPVSATESQLAITVLEPGPPVVNHTVTLAVSDYPDLGTDGGSVIVTPQAFPDTLIVVRLSASDVRVDSAICPHLQCRVGFDQTSQNLFCPCHGSEFKLTGELITGPALTGLTHYAATFDGQNVVVQVA